MDQDSRVGAENGDGEQLMFLQKTIRKRVQVRGIGLHTGAPAHLTFCPAPANTGVYFIRTDLSGRPAVAARCENVTATSYATSLGGEAFSISTVEHCLSALAALRIDNMFIELDGPEIPICDGSAQDFLAAILKVGAVEQDYPRQYAYVTQPIYYGNAEKHAYIVPYNGLRVTSTIEFPHPCIGRQKLDLDINEHSFARDLAKARTFGFLENVEALRARGLAKGGSFENAIVLDHDSVLNPGGLRFADEFVRHKIMDALGDLVMLGMPLLGHLVLYRAGHDVVHRLVQKIRDSRDSFRLIELGGDLPATTMPSRWARAFS